MEGSKKQAKKATSQCRNYVFTQFVKEEDINNIQTLIAAKVAPADPVAAPEKDKGDAAGEYLEPDLEHVAVPLSVEGVVDYGYER